MDSQPETVQDWLDFINKINLDSTTLNSVEEHFRLISDQDLLYQLALRLSDLDILNLILPSLSDEYLITLLRERNNPKVKRLLIEYIDDVEIIKQLFFEEKNLDLRVNLLKNLLEQYSDNSDLSSMNLHHLLFSEKSSAIRSAIIPHLDYETDKELIESIVFGEEFIEPRAQAARLITNQETILTILDKEQNGDVRYEAVKNLENEDKLRELVEKDLYWKVRQAALEKIDNQEVLLQAAASDPSMEIRLYAIERIQDPNLLASLAMNETAKVLRKRAIELIITSGDTDTLLVIAQEEEDPEIQMLAISHISHQQVLFDLIHESNNTDVREHAINQLTDIDILIELMRDTGNLRLQRAIVNRLADLEEIISLELLESETTGSVRSLIQSHLELFD